MREKVLLVTGATGNSGYTALKCMSKSFNVRAGSFNKSAKRDIVRELPNISAVYEFDAEVMDSNMDAAFAGCDYAYLIPSRSRNRVQHIKNYVYLAKKHNLKFLLLFSMLRPDNSSSSYARQYDEIERIVEDSGIPYAIIRNTLQQQTFFLFQPDIAKGVIPLPIGKGKFAPVHVCDISCLACEILKDPFSHSGKAFHLTGPQLVNGEMIAEIASKALKTNIRFIHISNANCKKLLMDSGLEETLADEFVELFSEVANDQFNICTGGMYASITGKRGLSLNDFFSYHRERFRGPPSVKPLEEMPEGMEDKGAKKKPPGTRTTVVEVAEYEWPSREKRDMEEELERTKDLLHNWIGQQENLVGLLKDMQMEEDRRKKEFCNFHREVCETLQEIRK